MNDFIYLIGDLFEASFDILSYAGNFTNIILVIIGIVALYYCGKISVSKKNILE